MDSRDITFAAFGGIQSCRAAHGEKLGAHALLLQLAKQVVEANAVAPDHHEVSQLKLAAQKEDEYLTQKTFLDTLPSSDGSFAARIVSKPIRQCC